MRVKELIEQLQKLPQDKPIMCQVVAQEAPGAWNMHFDVQDIESSWMVQLRVWHPDIKALPDFPAVPNAEIRG